MAISLKKLLSETNSATSILVADSLDDLQSIGNNGSSDDCVLKTAQTLTDLEKQQVGINTGFRYKLLNVTPTLQLGTTYNCIIEDYAINTIQIDSATKTYRVLLPQALDNRARDFVVRFEVTCSENPNIVFVPNGSEDVDYESDNDNWATVVPGVNMMTFTEIKRT